MGPDAQVGVRFRTTAACVLVAGALAAASPAAATIVRAVGFGEQCATADTIVVGTVRAIASRRVPTAPAWFETLVTVGVDEIVAGKAADELTLRFAGGQVGAVRQSIDGMPEFAVGERYVVFLEPAQSPPDPPLLSPIVGFNQGLYRVERVDGVDLVRDRSGAALPESVAAALSAPGAAAPAAAASPALDDFLAAVRAARR
jgi:hypothetical protein